MSDLQQILSGAQEDGLLSPDALDAMNIVDLGATIQDNLGVDPDAIDSNEVFGLFVLLDDSTSIRVRGNIPVVREGYNGILDSLIASQARDDIIVSTMFLNKGMLNAPTPLTEARKLDKFNPSGQTPLYDRTIELCALATAKYEEFRQIGSAFRGVVTLITDGGDLGSKADPRRVKAVIDSLQAQEIFQVIALGIEDGSTDFRKVFSEMGVWDNLILTVSDDPSSIRQAFGVVSRATVSASQGGSLSQTGLGAFGAFGAVDDGDD